MKSSSITSIITLRHRSEIHNSPATPQLWIVETSTGGWANVSQNEWWSLYLSAKGADVKISVKLVATTKVGLVISRPYYPDQIHRF